MTNRFEVRIDLKNNYTVWDSKADIVWDTFSHEMSAIIEANRLNKRETEYNPKGAHRHAS